MNVAGGLLANIALALLPHTNNMLKSLLFCLYILRCSVTTRDFESVLEVRNLRFFFDINSIVVFVLLEDIESS